MSYSTGTALTINAVLDLFATFLSSAGWTIVGNWREPMLVSSSGPTSNWRYARRLLLSKGNKALSLQDYYLGPINIQYGTNGGTPLGGNQRNGPGIAMIAGTAATGAGGTDVAHPITGYDTIGPATSPTFAADVSSPVASTTGVLRTVIMPLPAVTHQDTGSWVTGGPMVTDGVEVAPFGTPGGSAIPMKYWMMADSGGDNVILVVLHDGLVTPLTTYLFFGDLRKSGGFSDTACYYGASHSNINAFTGVDTLGHEVYRFGPPASMQDGYPNFAVHVDVDTTTGKWPMNANVALNPGTGRRLSSTTEMVASSPLGIIANTVHYGTLASRRGSLSDGAPLLPTTILVERDSGLWSVIGDIPTIFQARTIGFAPGTEWTDGTGRTFLVFDGFAVLKVP